MKKKQKKPKVIGYSKLKKILDVKFSAYIRQKYADRFGMAECFTCGVRLPWQKLQNGHYVSRTYLSLRWDERNCHPQCMPCNVWKHGAMDAYALKLQAKYGENILQELWIERNKPKKFTPVELRTLIDHYSKVQGVL